MRIYYRGYVIDERKSREPAFMVQGLRPSRDLLAFEESTRSAMRWIDRQVIRQKVYEAGWLAPSAILT